MTEISEATTAQEQAAAAEVTRLKALANRTAAEAEVAIETIVDSTVHAAETTVDTFGKFAHRTAERGREMTQQGTEAVTEAQASLVDVSYKRSRHFVQEASGVADVYRNGVERTTKDVQALVGVYSSIGRGIQRYQKVSLDLLMHSMHDMAGKRQDLYQAKSPMQFAEAQRDLYIEGVNSMLTGWTTLLQLVGEIARDTVRPLQKRAEAHK
jgi:hypothetical protein